MGDKVLKYVSVSILLFNNFVFMIPEPGQDAQTRFPHILASTCSAGNNIYTNHSINSTHKGGSIHNISLFIYTQLLLFEKGVFVFVTRFLVHRPDL